MSAYIADTMPDDTDATWLDDNAPKLRRERRRALNAQHKTHGNGAWRPFVAITPAMIALAAQACR